MRSKLRQMRRTKRRLQTRSSCWQKNFKRLKVSSMERSWHWRKSMIHWRRARLVSACIIYNLTLSFTINSFFLGYSKIIDSLQVLLNFAASKTELDGHVDSDHRYWKPFKILDLPQCTWGIFWIKQLFTTKRNMFKVLWISVKLSPLPVKWILCSNSKIIFILIRRKIVYKILLLSIWIR